MVSSQVKVTALMMAAVCLALSIPVGPGQEQSLSAYAAEHTASSNSARGLQNQNLFVFPLEPGWNLVSFPLDPVDPDINAVFGGADSIDAIVTSSDLSLGSQARCNPLDSNSLGADCLTATRSDEGAFTGTLLKLESWKGYWVLANRLDELAVELEAFPPGAHNGGTPSLPPVIDLKAGFNLVGIAALNSTVQWGDAVSANEYLAGLKWAEAFEFTPASGNFLRISPGSSATLQIGKAYYLKLSEGGVLLPLTQKPEPESGIGSIQGSTVTVQLSPGWNLVSLPGTPQDPSIDSVLGSSVPVTLVYHFDPQVPGGWLVAARQSSASPWVGDLPTLPIEGGKAYWMLSDAAAQISVELEPFVSVPTFPWAEGWNIVGISVLGPHEAEIPVAAYLSRVDWLSIYTFDTVNDQWGGFLKGTQPETGSLSVGKGYWIFVESVPDFIPSPPPEPVTDGAVISDFAALSTPSGLITYTLTLTGATLPGEGEAYQSWLVSDDGSSILSTGVFSVDSDGTVYHRYASPLGENLIEGYSKSMITVEPIADPDPGPSGNVLFSDEVSPEAMAHIRYLLSRWPPGSDMGILTRLKEQLQSAIEYANLAASSANPAEAARHLERVVDTIEGESGILTYIAQGQEQAELAASDAPSDEEVVSHAHLLEINLSNAEGWTVAARDAALDAIEQPEVNSVRLNILTLVAGPLSFALHGFDEDHNGAIESVIGEGGAAQAYVEAQLMASYRFPQ